MRRLRRAGLAVRMVSRPLYAAVVGAESVVAQSWSRRRGISPYAAGDVTVTLKTFERPRSMARTLRSLRPVFAGPVMVADDSAEPAVLPGGVRGIRLPFDSGIGAGRQALLAAVTTEFVLMADDDFIFLRDFDIARAVAYLRRNPEVDLYAGRVVNLPHLASTDYTRQGLYARRGTPRVRQGTFVDGLPVRYKTANFYLARTDSVRSVGYDPALKRMDHNDFFTAAFGRLVCVEDRTWVCLHDKTRFDRHYLSYRESVGPDLAYLEAKWGHTSAHADGNAPLAPVVQHQLHWAAIELVAADLNIPVRREDEAHSGDLAVATPDPAQLVVALRQVGWVGRAPAVRHSVWGVARIEQGPADVAPRRATTPVPVGHVARSPRAAVIAAEDDVIGAALPDGPALVLSPVAEAVWDLTEDRPATAAYLLNELSRDGDVPDDADARLTDLLDDLVAAGLLDGPMLGSSPFAGEPTTLTADRPGGQHADR